MRESNRSKTIESPGGDHGAAPSVTQRVCPVCGADDYAVVMKHDTWRLGECRNCTLAYLPEIPSAEAIETDFDWDDSFARERLERWARNPFFRAWTLLTMIVKPNREVRAMRRIRRLAGPGRMLDIGCGDGRLGATALRYGYEPVGVDLSPKMVAKARQRLGDERVLCGRLEDFALEPGSFDLVVAVSYLEHDPEPGPMVRRMFELLRPGGVCALKVPNYGSKLRRLLGRRWSGFRWPEHLQYFSPLTLGRLMADAGFEPLAISAPALGDNLWLASHKPLGNGGEN